MTSPGGTEITVTTNGVMASPGLDSDEKALLAKLEEANRLLEADEKSLKSLSAHSSKSGHSRQGSASGHSLKTHSRQGSISSMMSGNSVSSNLSNLPPEDMSGTTAEEAWVMWGDLVNDWESISKKRPNLIRELVRKGIPHHFRGIVWPLLCEAADSSAKEKYAEYLKMSSPCERLIRRDIARTYPEHDFFKEKNGLGQESLFNVMKAYSILDKEVGYCQGSGFIVGLLLMQMPEEEAFAVFVAIMQEYKLRELFKPNMIQLGLCMFQLDCMVQEQLLPLHNHFQSHGFCPSMFASSWFLTLFTSALTLNVACRIFDIFLLEGLETIFRVGFAILQMCQIDLLQTDLEGMLRYFQKVVPAKFEECPDILLSTAFQVKYSSKRMKKLEKEYNQLKTKEQEEQVEVRRLRSENKLLRQRIENLEKETETLAGRLVQQQVNSAQREEEQFGLKRELSQLKQRHHNTLLKLDTAKNELGELKDRNNSVTSTDSSEDLVQQLQQELSRVRHQEVESAATIRELKAKLRELDNVNQQLQRDPTVELQQLQEDLIACKMREAESSLSLKELQQKVIELEKTWHKIHEKGPIKDSKQQLTEEIMTMRIREAHAIGELREMKQKVMDLETQNQINQRHIKRMEEEKEKQVEKLEESEGREKELRASLKDLDRKLADHESQRKEEAILSKIKDTEHSQMVAELRRRVAELEIENQELVTAGQLQDRKGENHALQCRIAELEEEIMQLKMAKKLHSLSSLALNHITFDTESETDDMELMRRSKGSNSGMTDSIMKLRLELDSTTEEEGSCDYEADNSNVKRKTSRKKRKSHYSSKDVTPKSHQANRSLSDDSALNDSLDTTLKEDLTVIYNGASSHEPDRAGVMMDVTSISTDSGIPKDKADTSREASPLMSDTSNPLKDGAA